MNLAMADNHDYNVPAEKIDFYRKHGWVVLEDVVSPAEIKRSVWIHSLGFIRMGLPQCFFALLNDTSSRHLG